MDSKDTMFSNVEYVEGRDETDSTDARENAISTHNIDAIVRTNKPSLLSKNSLKLYFCLLVSYLVSTMNGYDGSLM